MEEGETKGQVFHAPGETRASKGTFGPLVSALNFLMALTRRVCSGAGFCCRQHGYDDNLVIYHRLFH